MNSVVRNLLRCTALALLITAATPCFSQSNTPDIDAPFFIKLLEGDACAADKLSDDDLGAHEKELALVKCKYVKSRIELETEQIRGIRDVYELQYIATVAGTIFVHLAILVGIIASTMEFWSANRMRRRSRQIEQQEFSVSMNGFAVKTTFIGFLLLFSSMGLYFLYLKSVYPVIKHPESTPTERTSYQNSRIGLDKRGLNKLQS